MKHIAISVVFATLVACGGSGTDTTSPPLPPAGSTAKVFVMPLGVGMVEATDLLVAPVDAMPRSAGYSIIVASPAPFHGVTFYIGRPDSYPTTLTATFKSSTDPRGLNEAAGTDSTMTWTRPGDVKWTTPPADWAIGSWWTDARFDGLYVMRFAIDPTVTPTPFPAYVSAVRIIP